MNRRSILQGALVTLFAPVAVWAEAKVARPTLSEDAAILEVLRRLKPGEAHDMAGWGDETGLPGISVLVADVSAVRSLSRRVASIPNAKSIVVGQDRVGYRLGPIMVWVYVDPYQGDPEYASVPFNANVLAQLRQDARYRVRHPITPYSLIDAPYWQGWERSKCLYES
jgi:hypothetical protein